MYRLTLVDRVDQQGRFIWVPTETTVKSGVPSVDRSLVVRRVPVRVRVSVTSVIFINIMEENVSRNIERLRNSVIQ